MGNKEQKIVYLTFDQGYEAGYTPKILDVLKKYGIKQAIFLDDKIFRYSYCRDERKIKNVLNEMVNGNPLMQNDTAFKTSLYESLLLAADMHYRQERYKYNASKNALVFLFIVKHLL